MKLIRLIMLLAALLALHGCGFKDVPDVDVKKAILFSPEGEFEFKRDEKYPTSFYSSDGGIKISLFPIDGDITFISYYNKRISIKDNKAFYQLNNGTKNRLTIKRRPGSHKFFDIISPETMYYFKSDGDGLHVTRQRKKITREHKSKINNEIYRYYIPFVIDNKDYVIDITFKLDIDTTLRFGAPGMP
jgi:hypothetical protein